MRSSSEQNSYKDVTALINGHINQTNNSIIGVISLRDSTYSSSTTTGELMMNSHNYNGLAQTAPSAEHQLQLLQRQQTQQQQKSSLSSQLSSLTSFLSGQPTTNTNTGNNNNNNTNATQGNVQLQGYGVGAQKSLLVDPTKPKVNVAYNMHPIINSYTTPQIHQVLFIDRIADMISPMLIQRTYEGLLDEMVGVNGQAIEYENATGAKAKLSVNNSDVVYNEFRDINIKVLGAMFSEKWASQ
eukprot:UN10000